METVGDLVVVVVHDDAGNVAVGKPVPDSPMLPRYLGLGLGLPHQGPSGSSVAHSQRYRLKKTAGDGWRHHNSSGALKEISLSCGVKESLFISPPKY